MIFYLLVGCLAGYIAGRLMDSRGNIIMYMLLGVLGSFVGNILFRMVGFVSVNFFGHLFTSIVGACVCIWLARKIR